MIFFKKKIKPKDVRQNNKNDLTKFTKQSATQLASRYTFVIRTSKTGEQQKELFISRIHILDVFYVQSNFSF